ncbi:MAG: hypothetical protein J6M24_01710 [Lachnospiraceae bacterium]|nr:hypothetical protein [Lachnospiraceae bacterium]
MTYNSEGANSTEYAHVGYKIKDSEGVVVSSDSIMIGQLAQGETMKDTGYLSGDFYLGESYSLEFIDVK